MAVQGCASALLEIDSAEAGWKVKWDGCPGCRLQLIGCHSAKNTNAG